MQCRNMLSQKLKRLLRRHSKKECRPNPRAMLSVGPLQPDVLPTLPVRVFCSHLRANCSLQPQSLFMSSKNRNWNTCPLHSSAHQHFSRICRPNHRQSRMQPSTATASPASCQL